MGGGGWLPPLFWFPPPLLATHVASSLTSKPKLTKESSQVVTLRLAVAYVVLVSLLGGL